MKRFSLYYGDWNLELMEDAFPEELPTDPEDPTTDPEDPTTDLDEPANIRFITPVVPCPFHVTEYKGTVTLVGVIRETETVHVSFSDNLIGIIDEVLPRTKRVHLTLTHATIEWLGNSPINPANYEEFVDCSKNFLALYGKMPYPLIIYFSDFIDHTNKKQRDEYIEYARQHISFSPAPLHVCKAIIYSVEGIEPPREEIKANIHPPVKMLRQFAIVPHTSIDWIVGARGARVFHLCSYAYIVGRKGQKLDIIGGTYTARIGG